MSIAHEKDVLKSENLTELLDELQAFVRDSAQQGTPIHEVERTVWHEVLRIGHHCLGHFIALQGTGDLGETVAVAGQTCHRLDALHRRRYVSIFGGFDLWRVVYGSREGQKLDFVPLDQRLQLPASAFSYVLQDWDQALCVQQAFAETRSTVARMLELQQSVDSLERMNEQMAELVSDFREDRPMPAPETEGEILVLSADGKGVVMRRAATDPAPAAHRTKGEKASQKRMATVGAAYTVDRYLRTPEAVVAALFRDAPEPARDRPRPQHKQVWASLPRQEVPGSGSAMVFEWLLNEVVERNPGLHKEMVFIGDGQETLWLARQQHLPQRHCVDILDLLHVTPRLWQAAHVFHREKSPGAEQFVRERVLRVLQGKAAGVVRGLREMATKQGLSGAKKKTLARVCQYLEDNLPRMRYDEYLAAGYPIASGVIEGACRHLVKDRMERAGMHWTIPGAQAMLDVRSVFISGQWEAFQAYRIEREVQRLYPHRHLVAGDTFVSQEPQYSMSS